MKLKHQISGLMIMMVLAGCAQADRANTHLGAMDDTSKSMLEELKKTEKLFDSATKQIEAIATALTALKDMGVDVMNLMKTAFVRKPAGGTDDIGSVLGEPATQPKLEETVHEL